MSKNIYSAFNESFKTFPASGSFEIILDDGQIRRTLNLSMPYIELYIPAGFWRELDNFSSGSICLVKASRQYDEQDYIRDFQIFKNFNENQ